ncbi:MAG: hypothetical protein PVF54_10770 [Anaerolineae bacterium]
MNIVLVGSAGRCGIHEYSLILAEGFRDLGHRARYIGVRRHDNRDLVKRIRAIGEDDDLVIFEYEPGIFWLGGLIRAMAWLRFWRRKKILLSVHEIAAEKYTEFRRIQRHLFRPVSHSGLLEIAWVFTATVDVAVRFLMLRVALLVMGWLPHAVFVHSPKAAENVRLALIDGHRIHYVPLVIKQLTKDSDALRKQLGLPRGVFAFVIPGFLFRRKRIIEVIKQLPSEAELWIVGTASSYDPGYLEEIEAYLAQSDKEERVRLIQDYERMEQHLIAADAAVLFYADAYQSGMASLAIGAGKPCIFSDLAAFTDLREAALTARTPRELHQAMVDIQKDDVYTKLVESAADLRQRLAPGRIAEAYLAWQDSE